MCFLKSEGLLLSRDAGGLLKTSLEQKKAAAGAQNLSERPRPINRSWRPINRSRHSGAPPGRRDPHPSLPTRWPALLISMVLSCFSGLCVLVGVCSSCVGLRVPRAVSLESQLLGLLRKRNEESSKNIAAVDSSQKWTKISIVVDSFQLEFFGPL